MTETELDDTRQDAAGQPVSAAGQTETLPADRRRPGRAPVNPALLPLLRRTHAAPAARRAGPDETDFDPEAGDALKPARGIALGLLLSVPLWAAIIAACTLLLHLVGP